MIRKSDMILFVALLTIGAAVFAFDGVSRQPGVKVKVISGGDTHGVYEIGTDHEIVITGTGGLNVISLSNGTAKMKEANCAGGDCLRQRPIDKTGQSIVCLPNQVLVSIEGATFDEIDSVAY